MRRSRRDHNNNENNNLFDKKRKDWSIIEWIIAIISIIATVGFLSVFCYNMYIYLTGGDLNKLILINFFYY